MFRVLGSVYAEQAAHLCSPGLAGGNAVVDGCSKAQTSSEPSAEEYTLMSIDTIINGKVGPDRGSALGTPMAVFITTCSCRKACFLDSSPF